MFGDLANFNQRLEKFKNKFSIEGIKKLTIIVASPTEAFKTIFWAWDCDKIPDCHFLDQPTSSLVLCGVITDPKDVLTLMKAFDEKSGTGDVLLSESGDQIITGTNGSFSCVYYEKKSRQAIVFADRFASRSIWIGNDKNIWIIGNFPSAVVSLMEDSPKLDATGLWSLFHSGRQVGNRGLYSGVTALMAGQKALLSLGSGIRISSWWKRRYAPEKNWSPREWGFHLARAIKRSAERYKRISGNPYLFLSGGLDSRIVAAAFGKPLKTLTLCTYPNVESRIAAWVAKTLGLEHETILRSPHWYYENTQASALISSGIYLNHHAHFITPVKRVSLRGIDAVFLLGDLMENFNKHYFLMSPNRALVFSPDNIIDIFYSCVPYTIKNYRDRWGKLFNKKIRGLLEERYLLSLKEHAYSVMEMSESHEDRFDAFLRWSNVAITPTYNMISCIWPFASERNLYFDNDLDDLSLRIPGSLRGKAILHNWILYYLNKILLIIPDANTFLPPVVPKQLGNYTKKVRPLIGKIRRSRTRKGSTPSLRTSGSWLLLHEMYRKDAAYKQQIEKLLNDSAIFPPDLFDLDEMRRVWQDYCGGQIRYHLEIEAIRSFGSLAQILSTSGIDL
ncbi:MAG: asparagine synthase-related protein [Clostridiales bacterium]|nr:asparagine synthase-related protein [Clostridiales bacterium]